MAKRSEKERGKPRLFNAKLLDEHYVEPRTFNRVFFIFCEFFINLGVFVNDIQM